MIKPPKDFDLPTSPMPGEFYVPPKARSEREADRRRALTRGQLVLEKQQEGLHIARLALVSITDVESRDFALGVLNPTLLNTAWHTSAQQERQQAGGVRRRRFKYPWLPDWQDADHLYMGAKNSLSVGEGLAAQVTLAHSLEQPSLERRKRDFAYCIGDAALMGACVVGLGENPIPGSPLRAQQFAREQGIRLIESRAAVAQRIGSAPTLAQLADQDSDLAVYWRRHAPSQAFDAYAEAIAA